MSDAVTILALNSSENGLERFKLNASKAVLVDGSASTQPVSGSVAISSGSVDIGSVLGTVTVDGSASTQPVSGSVAVSGVSGTVTVDASGSTVPVSGTFFQATQPVSGTVSISGNVNTVGGSLSVANTAHFSSQSITSGSSAVSTSQDISSAHRLLIYGDTNNLMGEVGVEISFNNSDFYDLGLSLFPDGSSGNIALEIESSAKYIRFNKSNNSGVSETISLAIMVKS